MADGPRRVRAWSQSGSASSVRFYVSSRETGEMMLLSSQVFTDGREVGELAEAKKKEFEAKDWS